MSPSQRRQRRCSLRSARSWAHRAKQSGDRIPTGPATASSGNSPISLARCCTCLSRAATATAATAITSPTHVRANSPSANGKASRALSSWLFGHLPRSQQTALLKMKSKSPSRLPLAAKRPAVLSPQEDSAQEIVTKASAHRRVDRPAAAACGRGWRRTPRRSRGHGQGPKDR
jgi:hypothetical protein